VTDYNAMLASTNSWKLPWVHSNTCHLVSGLSVMGVGGWLGVKLRLLSGAVRVFTVASHRLLTN